MLFFFRQEAQEAAVYVASDVYLHRLDGGHLYHVGGDCNCDHVRSHDCTHRGQSNDLKVGPGYAHIHDYVHIHDTATKGNKGSFILAFFVLRFFFVIAPSRRGNLRAIEHVPLNIASALGIYK